MNLIRTTALALLLSVATTRADITPATFDHAAIRDPATLETRIIQDWKVSSSDAAVRQKVIEITVCEWWPGQKIRLPVVLNAPASGALCRNVIIGNTALNPRPAMPSGAALRLLKERGIGAVLIGMGTIEAMKPTGTLHVGMREHLLATQNARFTSAWIWGISDMRALTAAIAEKDVFQPDKVLATGGSKRGIAAAAAGIHDDRFTAIVPLLAPPLGSPGGAYVVGTDSAEVQQLDKEFLEQLARGKVGHLPDTARAALVERDERQIRERVTLAQAREAGWTEAEIAAMNREAWETSRVTRHLTALRRRGLEIFYNVGTNDNVSPALVELGERFPDFPLYIVPGGQHGLKGAGFVRHVLVQPEVEENIYTFAQHHFFGARDLVAAPQIQHRWDATSRRLEVTVVFPDGTEPEKSELWWSFDRHPPGSLPFEYDAWQSAPLRKVATAKYAGELEIPTGIRNVEFVSTHRDTANGLSFSVSSPLRRLNTSPGIAVPPPVTQR